MYTSIKYRNDIHSVANIHTTTKQALFFKKYRLSDDFIDKVVPLKRKAHRIKFGVLLASRMTQHAIEIVSRLSWHNSNKSYDKSYKLTQRYKDIIKRARMPMRLQCNL